MHILCHFSVLEPCTNPRNFHLLLLLLLFLSQKSIAEQVYFSEKSPTEECSAPCEPWHSIWAWALNSPWNANHSWSAALSLQQVFSSHFCTYTFFPSSTGLCRAFLQLSMFVTTPYFGFTWFTWLSLSFISLLWIFVFFIPRSDGVCLNSALSHIIVDRKNIFLKRQV